MVEETKNVNTTAERVFLPSLLASFSCDMCGECCSVWEIPVDRDAYDRAVAKMGENVREHLEVADPLSHFGYARLKLAGGCCAFQDGRLCRIHRDHGRETLFPECRKFPRLLYRSPLGIHCTASFACRKAAESLAGGQTRVLHVMSDDVAFDPDLCDTVVEENPRLSPDRTLTWQALFALEHGFLEILREKSLTPEHRVLTMLELTRNLRSGETGELNKDTVDRELLAVRVDGFSELSNRFLLASSNAEAQADFVLEMIGKRLQAGLSRGWEMVPLEAVVSRWGELADRGRRQSFVSDFRRHYLPAGDGVTAILENYITCRVFGNPDFVFSHVQAGLKALAALLALARAGAVAMAAKAGSAVTPKMMTDSIRAVDTAFFHLPDFAEAVHRTGADPAELLIVTPG
jgi:hypothetical protein